MLSLSSADFFFKINLFKKSNFENAIRESNGLDPDQDRQNVGPDLGPSCLQRLSADDKIRHKQAKILYTRVINGPKRSIRHSILTIFGIHLCLALFHSDYCVLNIGLVFKVFLTLFGVLWDCFLYRKLLR